MLKQNKAAANMGGVAMFIAVAILIMVGAIIFAEFDDAASNLSTTTAAGAAIDNVTLNTYSSLSIVSVAPIILAAVVVLGIVMMMKR